ncbi:paraneoplastic antigen Ma6E-like [Eucalyptus grandis]|uniref:paraneoplastic antigen Ma6E-like n=1 Tax=Eucalyptus grandis TaxID=71139 RepID=UPI00192EB1D4|nr:paraneoplastic antigen Ma6E-like [Eucalyptus grandis]
MELNRGGTGVGQQLWKRAGERETELSGEAVERTASRGRRCGGSGPSNANRYPNSGVLPRSGTPSSRTEGKTEVPTAAGMGEGEAEMNDGAVERRRERGRRCADGSTAASSGGARRRGGSLWRAFARSVRCAAGLPGDESSDGVAPAALGCGVDSGTASAGRRARGERVRGTSVPQIGDGKAKQRRSGRGCCKGLKSVGIGLHGQRAKERSAGQSRASGEQGGAASGESQTSRPASRVAREGGAVGQDGRSRTSAGCGRIANAAAGVKRRRGDRCSNAAERRCSETPSRGSDAWQRRTRSRSAGQASVDRVEVQIRLR